MLLNTKETYGLVAQVLHWVTACLILLLIPLGVFMSGLPAETSGEAETKFWFYSLHKTLGVTVLLVAVVRVVWAAANPRPLPIHGHHRFEQLAAQTVHWLLYGTIIAMPLTGWLYHSAAEDLAAIWWPFMQTLPWIPKNKEWASLFQTAHTFTAVLLGVSVVLHIGGALKHALLDRDTTLRRMIPGGALGRHGSVSPAHGWSRQPLQLAVCAFVLLAAAIAFDFASNRIQTPVGKTNQQARTVPASGWVVDYKASALTIGVKVSGNSTSGSFARWKADIVFDPEALEEARIDVQVDVKSLSLGSVGAQAMSPDFLNAETHPNATFTSKSISKTGVSSYEAHGELDLAGQTRPLILPFSLSIDDDRASASGEAVVNRLDFGIGQKGFPKNDMIAFEVSIQFAIEAKRASPQ